MPTVLVVHDDPESCQLLATFLGFAGVRRATASDGRDALRQLVLPSPHQPFILLDLMMPIMDGIEFRRYQQRDIRLRGIPAICLSPRHDAGRSQTRLGIVEFFRKPFDLYAVAARCGDAVRRL